MNRVVCASRGSCVVEEVELVLHVADAPGAAFAKLNALPSDDSTASYAGEWLSRSADNL